MGAEDSGARSCIRKPRNPRVSYDEIDERCPMYSNRSRNKDQERNQGRFVLNVMEGISTNGAANSMDPEGNDLRDEAIENTQSGAMIHAL